MKIQCERPAFWDVKAILEWLVKGKKDLLKTFHGDKFGWTNKQELLEATVQIETKEYRLIAPDLIGIDRGRETYLVQALENEDGVDGFGRMPKQGHDEGRFATPLQIAIIVDWIDAGCPD